MLLQDEFLEVHSEWDVLDALEGLMDEVEGLIEGKEEGGRGMFH